ncbi:HigA protein (antitoxin to HigB) [Devosia sp. DBB001]|nr:HigA protein (antitoxin to HigB) [Devosia sp. DBB001]
MNAAASRVQPVAFHPGEILREEYLLPLDMSAGALARKLNVPRTRIERLVAETSPITTDTALRLAKFFSTTPQFWMNMQAAYDLQEAVKSLAQELDKVAPLNAA